MIWTPRKNVRRWGQKRFQRGIMGLMQTTSVVGASPPLPVFINPPYNVSDLQSPPTDSFAGLSIRVDGAMEQNIPAGPSIIGRWDNNGSFLKIDYDFRLDTISGLLNDPASQAADAWINSGSVTFFGVEETGTGSTIFNGTLRVRNAGGGPDLDTADVSLTSIVSP